MGEFVKVAGASEIAPGQARMVNIKGKEIAPFNIEGSFFALDNACTHEEGPLAEGDIEGPPHVTQNDSITSTGKRRRSAIDARTTRHEGYGMSQSRRAMTECIFGWGKQHGTMRKTKHRGIASVAADFLLNLIAFNLIRIPKLVPA
jgi:hypothetical protein